MDIIKINKAAGEVLAGMDKDLTFDEKIAVLGAARGVIDAALLSEMAMESRQRVLDNIFKAPLPFAPRKH
jgi:hypothetical protein